MYYFKKPMKPMEIIFIGAIIVIVGGIIGAIGTLKQNVASSAKSDKQLNKIEELNKQNSKLSNSLADLSSQNSLLSNNISKLSEQNGKLMLELSNARKDVDKARQESLDNTFGSMDGILVFGPEHLKLYNNSELPMYDVKVYITNYDALLNCVRGKDRFNKLAIESSCYHNATKPYGAQIIYGKSVVDIKDYFIDQRKTFKIIAKVLTKKGTYYQQLIHSEALGTAYRILEQENVREYWNQYLEPEKMLKIKDETFKVVQEKSLRKDAVDWDKEFPLPVAFNFID